MQKLEELIFLEVISISSGRERPKKTWIEAVINNFKVLNLINKSCAYSASLGT